MTPYALKLRDPRWQKMRLEKLNEAGWVFHNTKSRLALTDVALKTNAVPFISCFYDAFIKSILDSRTWECIL